MGSAGLGPLADPLLLDNCSRSPIDCVHSETVVDSQHARAQSETPSFDFYSYIHPLAALNTPKLPVSCPILRRAPLLLHHTLLRSCPLLPSLPPSPRLFPHAREQ